MHGSEEQCLQSAQTDHARPGGRLQVNPAPARGLEQEMDP